MIKLSNGGSAVGDFNGDGREDLIAFSPSGTSFHLLVSTGTGTYIAAPEYTTPNGAMINAHTVGDFNNDGKLDVAVTTAGSQVFYVYLGNGNGTFQSPSTHALSFVPDSLVAADVNHDGKMDLVMTNTGQISTFVTYLGNGAGGFSAGPTSDTNYYVYNLWTGDFDGDGKVDLFSANCGPGGCTMIVFYGDGAGHFGSPTTAAADQSDLTVADVDGDGRSDIITSTMGYINSTDQPYLSVFYGSADRTLQPSQIPTSRCTYGQPIVADFNGDHIPDVIFPEHDCSNNATSAQIAFLAGKGNRTFGSEQTVFNSTYNQQPGGSNSVLRANNSDTKPDFIFNQRSAQGSNEEYYVMVNQSSGPFAGCKPPNSATGFHVCSPTNGATVGSPVNFSIGAAGSVPMRKVEVWADGSKKLENLYAFSHYAFLDGSIALSPGSHSITVFAAGWDNSLQSQTYSINVGGGGGGGCTTGNSITVCSPTQGSTVSSPVQIQASTTLGSPTYRFELWSGSTKVLSVANSNTMNGSVPLSAGTHKLAFVARLADGTRKELDVTVTVK